MTTSLFDKQLPKFLSLAPFGDNPAWNKGDAAMVLIDGEPSNNYVLRSVDSYATCTPGRVTYFWAIIKPGLPFLSHTDYQTANFTSPDQVISQLYATMRRRE